MVRAILYDQDPVWGPPTVLAPTSCAPPIALLIVLLVAVAVPRRHSADVIFKREAVTMRAHVLQCDSFHSVTRCDNPPREVRTLTLNILHNAFTAFVF